MKTMKRTFIWGLLLAGFCATFPGDAADLTGSEILARVDEEGEFIGEGSFFSLLHFENTYRDGTTGENQFAVFGKWESGGGDFLLLYFLTPPELFGMSLLLSGDGEEMRIWQFSPALEEISPRAGLKELIAEERKQSFAGSTFSREEISGRFHFSRDYEATLLGEESIPVGDELAPCYLLEIVAKPGAEGVSPSGRMWIGKETFFVLRGEYMDEEGNLERVMEVLSLGEFEGEAVVAALTSTNTKEGGSTTITFQGRQRPEEPFPDEMFSPENLATFDPGIYGITQP